MKTKTKEILLKLRKQTEEKKHCLIGTLNNKGLTIEQEDKIKKKIDKCNETIDDIDSELKVTP
jgi:uncharacterized protein Yka (UPF0111/DUF47 family)